ncbi:YjdF family protein [Bacillus sp. FJAT-49736]|uniref:YjdF family protein n=1 Tax=Bacillus sp. FJAT-49736 TaxID=2833582 RepID=UPI001BC907BE|nr:YjdF family protein [Bacillus sp. FJAT-49736]MBS4175599.1 YjdF family protein [Bacillus sp. FJAT-49736]
MKLTIYYDGQFWVGVIEIQEKRRLKVYRYVFGSEPKDVDVLEFVNCRLLAILHNGMQRGVETGKKQRKAINPKRLQRKVAKELKQKGISTKAQEAIKEEIEQRKVQAKKLRKQRNDACKQKKWEQKQQKAKQKHKGR